MVDIRGSRCGGRPERRGDLFCRGPLRLSERRFRHRQQDGGGNGSCAHDWRRRHSGRGLFSAFKQFSRQGRGAGAAHDAQATAIAALRNLAAVAAVRPTAAADQIHVSPPFDARARSPTPIPPPADEGRDAAVRNLASRKCRGGRWGGGTSPAPRVAVLSQRARRGAVAPYVGPAQLFGSGQTAPPAGPLIP